MYASSATFAIQWSLCSDLCSSVFLNFSGVQMHFDEGLSARYKVGDSTKLLSKGNRGKSASEKLTEEGLVKFSARVAIQV